MRRAWLWHLHRQVVHHQHSQVEALQVLLRIPVGRHLAGALGTQTPRTKACTPSNRPTVQPSNRPTVQPSNRPTVQPSNRPTVQPSNRPTAQPKPWRLFDLLNADVANNPHAAIVQRVLPTSCATCGRTTFMQLASSGTGRRRKSSFKGRASNIGAMSPAEKHATTPRARIGGMRSQFSTICFWCQLL